MSFINGIGGAFIFSNDPFRLAQWYTGCFGFQFEGGGELDFFYQVFYGLDPDDPVRKLDTTFAIMRSTIPLSGQNPEEEPQSMYGDQPFMVNLRTQDLEALLEHLQSRGVSIIKRADESYGKFAWIRDIDGNRLELYQPVP